MDSSVKTSKNEFKPPVQRVVNARSNEMPSRAAPLSNKERLLLRKQALRMKKRPVIAVGNFYSSRNCQFSSVVALVLRMYLVELHT